MIKKISLLLIVLGAVVLDLSGAQAALSEYQGSASLTYTLASITGGDPSALSVTLDFAPDPANSYESLNGDGQVTISYPYPPPPFVELPLGGSVSVTLAASGEVNNGTVSSQHAGQFVLRLANAGSDAYRVNFGLEFTLSASATGQGAESLTSLEYFLEEDYPNYAQAYAHHLFSSSDSVNGGSTWSLDLAPGEEKVLTAQATISGNLEAVPLPAAVWLFLPGVALVGLIKKRCGKSHSCA